MSNKKATLEQIKEFVDTCSELKDFKRKWTDYQYIVITRLFPFSWHKYCHFNNLNVMLKKGFLKRLDL
ncbi:MAG: hypothetical protein WC307_06635 [Candidatus Nanoarchaeia archaeon]|jgi:hypothetical protein